MKNVNYVLGNCKKLSGIKFVLFVAALLSTTLSHSQTFAELFRDAKDDWTNKDNWIFSIDDDLNGQDVPGAFSWFANGGRGIGDLMMCLRKSDTNKMVFELRLPSTLIVENRVTPGATWDNLTMYASGDSSNIESNGDDRGMFISSKTGNKISLGDNDDEVAINAKRLILDYGGVNDVAQVAINAGNPVNGAVLTVGGMTYIGSSKNIEANPGLADDLKADCSLIVEKQVLASDLNIIPKPHWRDFVFENDYKKMDLKALEGYVKENKHLPGIVSEKEVKEKGYKIHVFNEGLLQNVEELLLHIIDQNKKIEELNKRIEALEK